MPHIYLGNFIPIYFFFSSATGKNLILGMNDGSIRVQPLQEDDAGFLGPYWSLTIHDNSYGRISQLTMSHDDQYLFTVGDDGNFFVFKMMDEGKVAERISEAKAKIPSAKVDSVILSI